MIIINTNTASRKRLKKIILSVCGVGVIFTLTYMLFFDGKPVTGNNAVTAHKEVPVEKVPAAPALPVKVVHSGQVGSGDTASSILSEWINPSEMHDLAQLCKPVFSLRQLRAGQPYRIYTEDDKLVRLEYEIDDEKYLVIIPQETDAQACANFTVETHDIEYEYKMAQVSGIITSNLFDAVEQSGENSSLAITLADIFGWEIDFIRDLRDGDSFSAVVEKKYRDGEFKGYRQIIAASFVNQGERHEGYRMIDDQGIAQYYNADGGNLRRAFLKAPLSFQRISSNYSNSRLHPILKTYRPHHGVDYAAAVGTPVHAIGDGTVLKIARDHAAGNYITLRHSNGYESGYLHLSGFAKGLKSGKRVSQGETIGYVGATGYATGPHLDFRMKKNNSFINPRTVISPRSEPVSKKQKEQFAALIKEYRPQLKEDGVLVSDDVRNATN